MLQKVHAALRTFVSELQAGGPAGRNAPAAEAASDDAKHAAAAAKARGGSAFVFRTLHLKFCMTMSPAGKLDCSPVLQIAGLKVGQRGVRFDVLIKEGFDCYTASMMDNYQASGAAAGSLFAISRGTLRIKIEVSINLLFMSRSGEQESNRGQEG